MNSLLVDSMVNLFAVLAAQGDVRTHKLVEIYTELFFSRAVNRRFGSKNKALVSRLIRRIRSGDATVNVDDICEEINRELPISNRLHLLINLFELALFIRKNAVLLSTSESINAILERVARNLNLSGRSFEICKNFVGNKLYCIEQRDAILIARNENPELTGIGYIPVREVTGYFVFAYFREAASIFFRYIGPELIRLNAKIIQPNIIYPFHSGSVISLDEQPVLFHTRVIATFIGLDKKERISLHLSDVSYSYPDSDFGIKSISLEAASGELIGVLGGSGVGKSTLFNVLNGNLIPQHGSISINGHQYSDEPDRIRRCIGFVPQDDSLFENLTVYENLYYTARLALGNHSAAELNELVIEKLNEFGLLPVKAMKVGSAISRNISGGQRKRLNIVSELIREPRLLLVDEPTSGLSSADSLKVMLLLKEQALTGKLVVVNIHQPSTEIYRLFDRVLVLDEGGHMVYFGNPLEAIRYFKGEAGRVDTDSVECPTCGNIRSDEIFNILEDKEVDRYGKVTESRKASAAEWSSRFVQIIGKSASPRKEPLPSIKGQKASLALQLAVFIKRLTLTKLRDMEFFIFAFVIPSVLALVIAVFSKYYAPDDSGGYTYLFYENFNIPIFFLTSIVACMFLGMIITSDTIIKDANVNKREALLFLSRKAYYNSKVIFYFSLSIVQTLIYTAISVWILEIRAMFIPMWLVLVLMAFFGNIAGLIVSALFRSISAAYLIVPFLVIPQIILSGITIPFERMNHYFSDPEVVPIIGIASPSMWGLEALNVYQFKENPYERYYFATDMRESRLRIRAHYLIPKLLRLVSELQASPTDSKELVLKQRAAIHGLMQLDINPERYFQAQDRAGALRRLEAFLIVMQEKLQKEYSDVIRERDRITAALIDKLGGNDSLLILKHRYTNRGVEDIALARKNITAIQQVEGKLIQHIDPIFRIPLNRYGRAHFLAPVKRIGNRLFDTFRFNVAVLWGFLLVVYLMLLFDIIPRLFSRIGRLLNRIGG